MSDPSWCKSRPKWTRWERKHVNRTFGLKTAHTPLLEIWLGHGSNPKITKCLG